MTRIKSESHLAFVRTLPCVVCGNPHETEAAHVRYADPRAAKKITGMGTKPDDAFVIPLCSDEHREQHEVGEKLFWKQHAPIDPVFVALALHRVSGDYEAGMQIVSAWSDARAPGE